MWLESDSSVAPFVGITGDAPQWGQSLAGPIVVIHLRGGVDKLLISFLDIKLKDTFKTFYILFNSTHILNPNSNSSHLPSENDVKVVIWGFGCHRYIESDVRCLKGKVKHKISLYSTVSSKFKSSNWQT